MVELVAVRIAAVVDVTIREPDEHQTAVRVAAVLRQLPLLERRPGGNLAFVTNVANPFAFLETP